MSRIGLLLMISGWRRRPWLRFGTWLVVGLGFGLAFLAGLLWWSGQDWLQNHVGRKPAADMVVLSAPGQSQTGFTQQELNDLEHQDFVLRLWPVTSNHFRARAGVQLGTTKFVVYSIV